MHGLHPAGQIVKTFGEGGNELKAEQRLAARNDDAGFREQLLYPRLERRLALGRKRLGLLSKRHTEAEEQRKAGCGQSRAHGNPEFAPGHGVEHDEGRGSKAKCKRQEAPAGQGSCHMDSAMAALPAAGHPVIHRGRNQKSDARAQKRKCRALQPAACRRDIAEELLRDALKGKAEQHLRAQDEEPGFIEGGFELNIPVLWSLQFYEPFVALGIPFKREEYA